MELERAGFFVVIRKKPFESTVYKVLSHDEWAEQHPDQCVQKIAFPWSGEAGDELGRRLYAASGGKVKLSPHLLNRLRASHLSDDTIHDRFVEFLRHWKPRNSWEERRYLIPRFTDVLAGLAVAEGFVDADDPELVGTIYRIYCATGHVFGNTYRKYLSRMLEGGYSPEEIAAMFSKYVKRLDPRRRPYAVQDFCNHMLTAV
jgi:hypothetical protein